MKAMIAALTLALASCGTPADTSTGPGAAPSHVAKIDLYVMSKCPYGVQAENALGPVMKQLGAGLQVHVDYIGQGEPGKLNSMHGPSEVTGDIAQLCAAKQSQEKAFDFILCQNENVKAMDTSGKDCATKVGLDAALLDTCMSGDEGQQLLAASFRASGERKATGSPTIYLDGQKYMGGRKTNDLLRAVCGTYGADAPQACKDLPVPPKVTATFLTDSRCKECDLKGLEGKLKGTFAGLEITTLDYNTPEGKAMYEQLQAADASFRMLPAVVFDPGVEKDTEGYPAISKYLSPIGDRQALRTGGKFDPKAEICDNTTDDDADGAVDCADDSCAASMICRPTKPKTLDLFVMSHCPYGAKALIATADAMTHFAPDDINLTVHYIGQEKGGELTSMHGPTEVDDDIREVCAQAKYPKDDQFIQFMACISKNYKAADWKACATSANMKPDVIQACFDGEGKDLLRKSFAEAAALGIGSSPTFLGNNKRTFNAVAADKLQQQYCMDNPGLSGCTGTITADASAAAPVPDGACGQ
jgi:predicted DsbA family dithiol-disulfide isomerase